ncbi:MAG: 3-deoxy-D-manno-octulosonic acid transferase, partial [Planctomycetaceae bacterium]
MIGWLLNSAYLLLVAAVSPVLVGRAVRRGKYRRGWGEKLRGRLPRSAAKRRVVWLHAVSVGEVLQLRTIVPRLREARPDCDVLITTTTSTGHAVARETYPDCRVSYFPLDFTWAVRAALARVRPALVVLVELELWPNFIRETDAAGVPLVLINGRMSRRSYWGYRRIRRVMRPLLARFTAIAVQTDEYAARLLDLGAPPERLTVTGSVKFDGVRTDPGNTQTRMLRDAFGIRDDERVFIAGSTHDPEERIALDAYLALRKEFEDLRLIIVPRHAERFDDVAAMVGSRGTGLVRRSECARDGGGVKRAPGRRPLCLLDTLG